MADPWDKSTKRVVAHKPVLVPPAPGHYRFLAPPPTPLLNVSRLALGVAMSRTGCIGHPPGGLVWRRAFHAANELADLIDESSSGFDLLAVLRNINGAERSALAGRIGAGLCDLLMQSLRYVWRDQASSYIKASRKPLGDFLYSTPCGTGVALAEAKGSTRSEKQTATQKRANDAYDRQVKQWLAIGTRAGPVLHGYAVSLSAPVNKSAYLCVAETGALGGGGGGGGDPEGGPGGSGRGPGDVPGPDDGGPANDYGDNEALNAPFPSRGEVNASIAVGNYATVLSLVGRHHAANSLRAIKAGEISASDAAEALNSLEPDDSGLITGHVRGNIAPYSAIKFAVHPEPLRELAAFLADVGKSNWVIAARSRIELPIVQPRLNDVDLVRCPDGLVGIAISREQALATEIALPPEVLDGARLKSLEASQEVRVAFKNLREALASEIARTSWNVAVEPPFEEQQQATHLITSLKYHGGET